MNKLRVWHIQQIPIKAFYVDVGTPEEAIKILDILAEYDMFQFQNRVKGDYCSAQGLEEFWEEENKWVEWYSEDDLDIRRYKESLEENHEQ